MKSTSHGLLLDAHVLSRIANELAMLAGALHEGADVTAEVESTLSTADAVIAAAREANRREAEA